MNIRVLHVVEDFSLANTGVTSVVRQISAWQAKHCEWVGVYVSGNCDLPAPSGVVVFEAGITKWGCSWRYPRGGGQKLAEVIRKNRITLLHIHGLWRANSLVAVKAALRLNVATILSVHGQTSRWALNEQGFLKALKKRVYWSCLANKWLSKVSCLHAITPLEQEDMARFFCRDVLDVVPNALHEVSKVCGSVTPKKYFIFLGRIHPVKGVENLIRAFLAANISTEWELLIVGPEEMGEYAAMLKEISKDSKRIKFLGPLYGEKKNRLLENAWALVAPSYTEVIGMVNLEAGALATPSLTSPETGLLNWERGGGMLVSNEPVKLQEALECVAGWPMGERLERGARSKLLVDQHYQLDVVGHQWVSLYEKVISKVAN